LYYYGGGNADFAPKKTKNARAEVGTKAAMSRFHFDL
jgi:hypothetical protein